MAYSPLYPPLIPVDHLKNDFRKDEFKVDVDDSGKLTVRGRRSLGDGKFMRLEQVFEVPKDSHINKISGKFEGGCLSLFMPKKVARATEVPQRAVSPENPRSVEPIQKEKQVAGDKEVTRRRKLQHKETSQRAVREKRKNPYKKRSQKIERRQKQQLLFTKRSHSQIRIKRNTLSKTSLFESRSQRAAWSAKTALKNIKRMG